ncbi:hypothetical protein EBB56_11875 [Halomonas sp. YLB-10]|nr:hypothetical protein EBB56_11875 [Halomonas sp. YLB-10]
MKRRIYSTRDAAFSGVFDYIVMLYNPRCCHGTNYGLSPIEYEQRYALILACV